MSLLKKLSLITLAIIIFALPALAHAETNATGQVTGEAAGQTVDRASGLASGQPAIPAFKPKKYSEEPIIRVASGIAPIKYLVDHIGGEFVNSIALMPAGSDPHTYEPKPSQLAALNEADVYFNIDTPFEVTWLPRFATVNPSMDVTDLADAALADDAQFEKIKDSLRPVKYVPHFPVKKKKKPEGGEGHGEGKGEGGEGAVSEGAGAHTEGEKSPEHASEQAPEHASGQATPNSAAHSAPNSTNGEKASSGHGEASGANGAANNTKTEEPPVAHNHEGEDPHVWLSPKLLQRMSIVICAKLSLIMPEQKLYFEKNLRAVQSDLNDLDVYIAASVKTLPENKKTFLVYHPAWGYFAKDYGLTQLAIEHEGKEVTPAMLGRTLEEAKSKGIQTVFVQKEFNPALAQNIAEQLPGGKVVALDPLGYNPIDSMKFLTNNIAGK